MFLIEVTSDYKDENIFQFIQKSWHNAISPNPNKTLVSTLNTDAKVLYKMPAIWNKSSAFKNNLRIKWNLV